MKLLPHPRKQILFSLLSLADLGLTWFLIGQGGGQVYESNPLAGWCLVRHGWVGLACFKVAVVLVVFALAAVISRFRPRAGGQVLGLGCAVLALVVLYSTALCQGAAWLPTGGQAVVGEENSLLEDGRRTWAQLQRKDALLKDLRQGLLAGHCTLSEAVRRLAGSELGHDRDWLHTLTHLDPDGSLEARLGVFLINHVVSSLAECPQRAWPTAVRLEREFQLLYGHPCPRTHRWALRAARLDADDGSRSPGPATEPPPVARGGTTRAY
jgi:hypothetical protein